MIRYRMHPAAAVHRELTCAACDRQTALEMDGPGEPWIPLTSLRAPMEAAIPSDLIDVVLEALLQEIQ